MYPIECSIAETRRQLDDALRVRYLVFAAELGYLDLARRSLPREVDPFDTLETTIHIVACIRNEAVGTVRLLLPNDEVARANGSGFGLDIESKFDLSSIPRERIRLAEAMRYCVVEKYRSAGVASALHAAALAISREQGITSWIGCANTETDSIDDARRIYSIGRALGFGHDTIQLSAHSVPAVEPSPRRPFFTQRDSCPEGRSFPCMRLPRTLLLYSQRMAAKWIGPPIYDTHFRMCSLPVFMAVDAQRVSTMTSIPNT